MIKLKDILLEVDNKPYINKTVYHGTNSRFISRILKFGLIPRPNSYYYKYADTPEEEAAIKKSSPSELYVSMEFDTAKRFAEEGLQTYDYVMQQKLGPEYRVNKIHIPIVLEFKIEASDKILAIDKNVDYKGHEIVLGSKVSPNRISIAYPKDFNVSDYIKQTSTIALDSRAKVKEINTILKPYKLKIKATSKTTDNASGEFLDPAKKFEFSWNLKLSNVLMYLKGQTVKSSLDYVSNAELVKRLDDFFGQISDSDKIKIINILKR